MRSAVTIILAFLLLSFAGAGPATAVSDSVSTASDIVNSFYAEAESLAGTMGTAKSTFKAAALEKKEKALSDLRSIGMSKKPSRDRYEQVRELTGGYMAGVISDIEALKKGPDAKHAARIDDIAAQLTALMDFKLKSLEETVQIESYEKKGPRPVPLIDRERTPFDNPPDEPPGIWFR